MSGPPSIVEAIAGEGGRVTFARFMEMALTHPTLGYYSRTERLLRRGGDFSTAPAISPFFNRAVARLVTELVDAWLAIPSMSRRLSIVELGGGEGHLAEGILRFWESERPELRGMIGYRVVEVGAALQQRQAEAVKALEEAGWDVGWGPDLDRACAGTQPVVIVGNEFLDAIPVHLVAISGSQVREAYVRVASASLEQTWGEVSDRAAAELELLFGTLDPCLLRTFSEDGVLELFPGVGDLMRQAAGVMSSGSFVTLDYGEWFPGPPNDAERWGLEGRTPRKRTVRGYFKHQLVFDPLARAGRQDLTADVDFAALDVHGRGAGFETVLFTTLARFLRGGGAEEELEALRGRMTAPPYPAAPRSATAEVAELPVAARGSASAAAPAGTGSDPLEADRQATVLENLLDERDLGGAFKLMVQVRE